MSAKSTRTYLSIGEVLSLLREDFPDVTISKIRFLEGQGLVSPERTSSGYRKFHEPDVERLRFVLRQQREHFLPLKVIRERMDEAGLAPESPRKPPGARRRSVSELVAALQETPPATTPAPAPDAPRTHAQRDDAPAEDPPVDPTGDATGDPVVDPPADERPRREPASRPDAGSADDPLAAKAPASVATLEEVAASAGLEAGAVQGLVAHGLVSTVRQGGVDGFDEDAVAVVKAAAGFLALGLEPRHLKVLQHGVQRELDMIETLVRPLLQQRTPEGRVKAREEATQLARLGQTLRAALLRRELRRTIG